VRGTARSAANWREIPIGLRVRIDQTDLAVRIASEPYPSRLERCQYRSNVALPGPTSTRLEHGDRPTHDTGFPGEFVLGPVQEHARGAEVARPQKIQDFACICDQCALPSTSAVRKSAQSRLRRKLTLMAGGIGSPSDTFKIGCIRGFVKRDEPRRSFMKERARPA